MMMMMMMMILCGLVPLLLMFSQRVHAAARPEEVKELNAFFKQLRAHKDLASKTVLIDDREMSINNFFQVSDANRLDVQDSWPITEDNVRDASRLLSAAVTCEYSYFAFGFAVLLDARLQGCANIDMSARRECLNGCRARLLVPALEHVASMLLTLTGLLAYTENVTSRGRQLPKVLLSLYAFLRDDTRVPYDDGMSEKQMNERLLPLRVTGLRLKSALERVIVATCQRPRRFEAFKVNTMNAVRRESARTAYASAGDGAIDECYGKRYDDLAPIASYPFAGPLFVFSPNDEHFVAMSSLIGKWTGADPRIAWGTDAAASLQHVYDTAIKNGGGADVRTVVRFEKALLRSVTRALAGAVADELRRVNDDPEDVDKSGTCNAAVLAKLEERANAFRAAGQPSYLVRNMVAIERYAWFVCYLMKEPGVHGEHVAANIEQLARENGTGAGTPRLHDVLDGLSGVAVMCGKLHPAVSNATYGDEEMYAGVADHLADYKDLSSTCHVQPNVGALLCAEVEDMWRPVASMARDIDECDGSLARGDADAVDAWFARFASRYTNLLGRTLYVDEHVFGRKCAAWTRLVVSLARGLQDDGWPLFGASSRKGALYAGRVRDLRRFHHEVNSTLAEHRAVYCALKPSVNGSRPAGSSDNTSVARALGYDDEYQSHESVLLRSMMATAAVASTAHVAGRPDEKCTAYRAYLRAFAEIARNISDAGWPDDECKLYQDGAERSVDEALEWHARFAYGLQDGHDLQTFVVDWMLAVPYVRLLDLLNEMILFKYKPTVAETARLKRCLANVLQLPWYPGRTVELNVLRYYMVVKDFGGADTGELENMRDVLRDELRLSSVVPHTMPNPKETFAKRVNELSVQIESLNSSYDGVRVSVHAAAKRIHSKSQRDLFD